MTNFTIASTSCNVDDSIEVYGQSFNPNVPGPNGTGSPGSATQVLVNSITVGYQSADDRQSWGLRIFDHKPLASQADSGIGEICESNNFTDGQDFGTNTFTREFFFDTYIPLDVTKTYYFIFPTTEYVTFKSPSPYSGGKLVDASMNESTTRDMQFKISLLTV